MRAAVLHTLGEPPSYDVYPDPAWSPGCTLVAVSHAPVVPLDLLCATGTSYFGRPRLPYVPGVQGVGTVVQSDDIASGERVWFMTSAGMAPGDGALAERCVVSDDGVVPIGSEVDGALMAALGNSALAAWMALTWRARMQPGERVLVLGAGGAVGQSAIGAAKVLGAGRVVAVCRSRESESRARRAGADDVVLLTGGSDDLAERVKVAGGGAVDVVVDPVFGVAASAASRVLAHGGRLVNIGGASGDAAEFSSAALRSRSAEILGYTNNALTAEQRRTAIASIALHAAAGRLRVDHAVRPLAGIAHVWATASESGRTSLRLVLMPPSVDGPSTH